MDKAKLLTLSKHRPQQSVEIKALDDSVIVRGLTIAERDEVENAVSTGEKKNLRSLLLARCLVDESGERIFTDDEIDSLSSLPSDPMEPAFDAALRLSGYSEEESKRLEKN